MIDGHVDGVGAQHVEGDDLQGSLVRRRQYDGGGGAVVVRPESVGSGDDARRPLRPQHLDLVVLAQRLGRAVVVLELHQGRSA